jgi:methionyl-tRNA formyltransferase
MNKSKKLIFFGTENFSVPSLEKLINAGYDIAAVVTKPDAAAGRGLRPQSPRVKQVAEAHGLTILQPKNLSESVIKGLQELGAGLGVLVAYGKILPPALIEVFPGGIINVHPSLLPKYRGPSPVETAILKGDKKTAVSLMKLAAEMDAGPVFAVKKVELPAKISRPELYRLLAEIGADLLLQKLPAIIDGRLSPRAQDNSQATYTSLLKKTDGRVDWQTETARQIERKVRAFFGYPKASGQIFGQNVVITEARLAASENDGALVLPTKEGYLEVLQLVAPSGRTISGADFIRGYKKNRPA